MGQKENILKAPPLVSAIITTHNRLGLLKRAVQSVDEQIYDNIELIVVDDASDDGTREWCESQQFKYIYIPKAESKGGNHARNIGVKASSGKYLAFLDDDDYWMPEKTLKQVAILEKTGNEVVHCFRNLEIIDMDGNLRMELCPLTKNYGGNLKNRILYQISLLTSAMIVRKEAVMEAGLFDEQCKFWQEYELSIRLAQRKPFELIMEPLFVYRIDSTDSNRLTNKYHGWNETVDYIYDKHKLLYGRLNPLSRLRVKILYWRESANRALACGMTDIYTRHHFLDKILNLPFRIYDKLKACI